MGFDEEVYRLASRVPKGKVTTYSEIAKKIGTKAYRAVGSSLKRNPNPITVPCHRVVKSDGSVGGYCGKPSSRKKEALLKKEGIAIINRKVADFENVMFRM